MVEHYSSKCSLLTSHDVIFVRIFSQSGSAGPENPGRVADFVQ